MNWHFLRDKLLVTTTTFASAMLPTLALAKGKLPTMEDPSRGAGKSIMETMQNYGFDIVMLVALLVVSSMFIGVCYHAYTRYSEIHTGRSDRLRHGLRLHEWMGGEADFSGSR